MKEVREEKRNDVDGRSRQVNAGQVVYLGYVAGPKFLSVPHQGIVVH